ncbi:MAG TPA: hypothetical protein VD902_00970 [Symbiobacteriaceae bacterium]|nr:hypothetical protein [Symbiobacteriaceae bacterium]
MITPENRIAIELLLLGLFFIAALGMASPARSAARTPSKKQALAGN